MKVKFLEYESKIKIGKYKTEDQTSISLIDTEDGEPVAIATVCIPKVKVNPGEVIIKNYSENEGILYVLIEAGIISEPKRYIKTGYVDCPVCDLLINN